MTRYQRAKRRATWVSVAIAALLYSLIMILPAIGGYITAEQPVTHSHQHQQEHPMPFMTTEELRRTRSDHIASIQRLHQHSVTWDAETHRRGNATLANLERQIIDIDQELSMAMARRAYG